MLFIKTCLLYSYEWKEIFFMKEKGDQAFLSSSNSNTWKEMTYGGALSFLRRKYTRNLTDADVVVSGVPYDCSVTNRPGCRFGPRAIRQASTQLAELNSYPFGFVLSKRLRVVDWGDCYLNPHHPETIIDSIESHAESIISKKCKMLTFGGDHFISYPLLKAHAKQYGPLSLIQFDAHCDTWQDDSTRFDHGTMFFRAVKEGLIDVGSSVQIGLRTFNTIDMGFQVLSAPWIHKNGINAVIDRILKIVKDNPVYISFDVDCLDPAFAPGTGTPVVGGLATWQVLEIIRSLNFLNLIGMDVVEVSPSYDHAEITSLAAATVAHDWLCVLADKK